MNSGHSHPHQKDSGEPFCWILRPTLQLKIKANSLTENLGQLLERIQANPPTPRKDSGDPFCWIYRPTLQLKIKANSSTEN